MFLQVSRMQRHKRVEMHQGDMWRHPQILGNVTRDIKVTRIGDLMSHKIAII
jgi:hypothetical protein